jgi:hypothetical protein
VPKEFRQNDELKPDPGMNHTERAWIRSQVQVQVQGKVRRAASCATLTLT